jgi:aminoglycoside 3-N-acetyltransferase
VLGPDGDSRWVTWDEVTVDEDDFEQLGAAFEATGAVSIGRVGKATARLMSQRVLVEFGTAWMAANRGRLE